MNTKPQMQTYSEQTFAQLFEEPGRDEVLLVQKRSGTNEQYENERIENGSKSFVFDTRAHSELNLDFSLPEKTRAETSFIRWFRMSPSMAS